MPSLSAQTVLRLGDARAALAALDSTARQLHNPSVFRQPSLRLEAQSTSALEGTYEPLRAVLTADPQDPHSVGMREVLNYVTTAEHAFEWIAEGRPITVGLLTELQRRLVAGTAADTRSAGNVRDIQVVIGGRPGESVQAARFVPHPPGDELNRRVRDLVDWVRDGHHDSVDPVVAAAMAHYAFETLHPFNDGNGRIGRLLVVLQLYAGGTLSEPTLTVSPWFEARRQLYYDRLFAVSTGSRWDDWIRFFAEGIAASATSTSSTMLAMVDAQTVLRERVRSSHLRADSAQAVVEFAMEHLVFTVREVQAAVGVSYPRANKLVGDLIDLEVLAALDPEGVYRRRFYAPLAINALTGTESSGDPHE
jgi:Fic family protein